MRCALKFAHTKTMSANLSLGIPLKTLLIYGLPFIATSLFIAIFNITDTWVMGRFGGTAGSAGAGIGGQIVYLFSNLGIGLSAGCTILVAKYFAKKNYKSLRKSVLSALIFMVSLALLLSLIMFIFSKPALNLLRTPKSAMTVAENYVKFSAFSLFFVFLFNLLAGISRGLGNSLLPMWAMLGACIVNLGLDLIFVPVLKLGGAGLALASLIAWGLASIFAFLYLIKKYAFLNPKNRTKLNNADSNRAKSSENSTKSGETNKNSKKSGIFKEFLKVSAPIALLNFFASLSFILLTFMVNFLFKNNAVSASATHSVAIRYNGFAMLPYRAMATAIAGIVSACLAVNKKNRIKPTLLSGLGLCLAYGLVVGGITFAFPEFIFKIFGGGKDLSSHSLYLRLMSLDYIILPLAVCAYGAVEGKGKSWISMVINLTVSLAVRLPVAYLFAKTFNLGLSGIGLAIPVASLFGAIAVWIYMLFCSHSNKKRTKQDALSV